jgi:hypothetical protein
MQKSPLKNRAGLLDTYVKAKTTNFFGLAMEKKKYMNFFVVVIANIKHRFIASMR